MPTTRTRVIVYVLREGRQLLVLEGPGGVGVPGGAVEPGSFEPDFTHESHYFEAIAVADAADVWEHVVTGSGSENGTRVRCRFVPFDPDLALAGGRGRYLSSL